MIRSLCDQAGIERLAQYINEDIDTFRDLLLNTDTGCIEPVLAILVVRAWF